jgi:hypothetical protein
MHSVANFAVSILPPIIFQVHIRITPAYDLV